MNKTAEEKIRCTEAEREAWTVAAREANVSRAEFIRRAANAAASSGELLPSQQEFLQEYAKGFKAGTPSISIQDDEHLGRPCRHNRAPGKFCPVCDKQPRSFPASTWPRL